MSVRLQVITELGEHNLFLPESHFAMAAGRVRLRSLTDPTVSLCKLFNEWKYEIRDVCLFVVLSLKKSCVTTLTPVKQFPNVPVRF